MLVPPFSVFIYLGEVGMTVHHASAVHVNLIWASILKSNCIIHRACTCISLCSMADDDQAENESRFAYYNLEQSISIIKIFCVLFMS